MQPNIAETDISLFKILVEFSVFKVVFEMMQHLSERCLTASIESRNNLVHKKQYTRLSDRAMKNLLQLQTSLQWKTGCEGVNSLTAQPENEIIIKMFRPQQARLHTIT